MQRLYYIFMNTSLHRLKDPSVAPRAGIEPCCSKAYIITNQPFRNSFIRKLFSEYNIYFSSFKWNNDLESSVNIMQNNLTQNDKLKALPLCLWSQHVFEKYTPARATRTSQTAPSIVRTDFRPHILSIKSKKLISHCRRSRKWTRLKIFKTRHMSRI